MKLSNNNFYIKKYIEEDVRQQLLMHGVVAAHLYKYLAHTGISPSHTNLIYGLHVVCGSSVYDFWLLTIFNVDKSTSFLIDLNWKSIPFSQEMKHRISSMVAKPVIEAWKANCSIRHSQTKSQQSMAGELATFHEASGHLSSSKLMYLSSFLFTWGTEVSW